MKVNFIKTMDFTFEEVEIIGLFDKNAINRAIEEGKVIEIINASVSVLQHPQQSLVVHARDLRQSQMLTGFQIVHDAVLSLIPLPANGTLTVLVVAQ